MVMKSNQNYWHRRFLQVKANEIKNTEQYERSLQPELNGLFDSINRDLNRWYERYANNQGISNDEARKILNSINTKDWNLTLKQYEAKAIEGGHSAELNSEYFKSRVSRLKDLEGQIKDTASKFADGQVNGMRSQMASQFEDTYMRETHSIQAAKMAFTSNFSRYSEEQLRMVVSKPWGKDGQDFSQRIWKNYRDVLPKYLMDSALRGTILGYSSDKIVRGMKTRFEDVRRNNIHRLIVSELGHIAEEATAKSYDENGIEQYEYMATLESHTCTNCGSLDGQVFKLKERKSGVNYPLLHARCRCTTVPYIENLPEVNGRWMRDPDTGKGRVIENLNFKDWKKRIAEGKPMPNPITSLTESERGAVVRYVSPDSYVLNEALRNSIPLSAAQQQWVTNLDSAIDKLPKYTDSEPLQRSMRFYNPDVLSDFMKDRQVGDVYDDNGYYSSSKGVYDPGDDVRIIIRHSFSGADLKGYNDNEKEVLFKRRTKFKIIKRYVLNGKVIMEVDEVD